MKQGWPVNARQKSASPLWSVFARRSEIRQRNYLSSPKLNIVLSPSPIIHPPAGHCAIDPSYLSHETKNPQPIKRLEFNLAVGGLCPVTVTVRHTRHRGALPGGGGTGLAVTGVTGSDSHSDSNGF